MFDNLEERVRHRKTNAYAIQFTNGRHDEYKALIHDTYDAPLIEVDCATIDDYDAFFEALADDLVTNPSDVMNPTWAVEDHFKQEGGSLILYNFHELDRETTSDLAMYIKGLREGLDSSGDAEFAIALTTDDTDALFIGNGDLTGRVLTLNIHEDYT